MENTRNAVDTFKRYFAMLRMVPRHPRAIDGAEIERKLAAEGIYVTRRTIQRDLDKLSAIVQIVRREGKPLGWSWAQDARLLELPGMDAATALTFRLVELFLQKHLPSMVVDSIQPHLRKASKILAATGDSGVAHWPEKIAVVPRGMEFLPPSIEPGLLAIVSEALFLERQITICYRRPTGDDLRKYAGICPLGLVFVDDLIYLVGAFANGGVPRQFLLHRMAAVEMLTERITVPDGFTLKGYVTSGEFAYPLTDNRIKLKAIFALDVAPYLRETPLEVGQRLTARKDGRILLEAEVADTVQLRYWLKGFGERVEVVGPKKLRTEFEEMVRALALSYQIKTTNSNVLT